jgi:hypothetical protein
MWYSVVFDISKDCSIFVFKDQAILDCLILEGEGTTFLEMAGATHLETQYQISGDVFSATGGGDVFAFSSCSSGGCLLINSGLSQ